MNKEQKKEYEQTLEDLELLDFNYNFGIYTKKEYKKIFKSLVKDLKRLENEK